MKIANCWNIYMDYCVYIYLCNRDVLKKIMEKNITLKWISYSSEIFHEKFMKALKNFNISNP